METTNGNKNGHSTNGHRLTFDNFEIDPANRTLLCDGEAVPLTGKVFNVLIVFAENPGRLLEKDELLEKVWPAEFVEEGNLARNVSTLRKALGDTGKNHKFIATVPGHGYRFVADVAKMNGGGSAVMVAETGQIPHTEKLADSTDAKHFSKKWLWAIPLAVLLIGAIWIGKGRFLTPGNQIKSIAVMPLKSLDAGDNYLGIGIADAVIRKISQTGQFTVRPTSAVLHYANQDSDALAAARELNTDAVLEGSVQRSGERLRVSVNLLRTSDGASLWSDSFDLPATDIFTIQDKVAQQVVTRLRPQFDSTQQARLNKRYTSNPIAYDYYVKAIYNLDLRGSDKRTKRQMEETIDFFRKAIDADPNYALAHAQLGYAYAWTAMFIDPEQAEWAALAKKEIEVSQALDPQLAEPHVTNALLLWSAYDGFQNEAAVRELLIAQQLNPSVGHTDLTALYQHIGLEDLASRELRRALEIDPTSKANNDLILTTCTLAGKYDECFAADQKMHPGDNDDPWYFLGKGRLEDAEKAIDAMQARFPDSPALPDYKALLFALKGDFPAAEAQIPNILDKRPPNHPSRHHATYDIACIYALEGKSAEAVKWLKETAATGFPNYPLFERDAYLDRIRQTPEFVQFMADEKARWEKYRQEFGE